MSVPVTNHFVRMDNPLSGELEWTLTYWMGSVGGFDMAVEWAVETADESVLRYEITELKLR
ncbi:MAG: hypothetical protein FH749_13245 [Firmicutes bacterium]|nr:hypothetical protein [Bacillota bacterium]